MALTILTNHPPKSAIMGVYRGKGQETGQRCKSGKNKAKTPIKAQKKSGAGDGDRTRDVQLGKLYGIGVFPIVFHSLDTL